jgi:hypothetical protein
MQSQASKASPLCARAEIAQAGAARGSGMISRGK